MSDTCDIEDIRSEWGEPDMVLIPGETVSDESKLHDDIAEEYWIYLSDKCSGNCIVYGRFNRGWIANPNLRWPLSELTRKMIYV
ncbi:MAG: hypothetical protein QM500_16815 [Methylococcales bacterium]